MTFKKTFLPALILSSIAIVCALALGFTNHLTKDRIAAVERERYLAAAASVLPEGAILSELSVEGVTGFVGMDAEGNLLGYAVKTVAKGYGGDISCVVGFDPSGRVIGVSVSAPDETPGLGTNVTKPSFTDQLIGKTEAPALGDGLDGVTGATYSSLAVEEAVKKAFLGFEKIITAKGA